MTKEEKQKGIILYVVLLIMSIFIAIVLTLAGVSVSQTKISFQAGDSVKAFTAADTGIEQALYNLRNADPFSSSSIPVTVLPNGSSYSVDIAHTPTTATIISKGVFQKTRRTIKATY